MKISAAATKKMTVLRVLSCAGGMEGGGFRRAGGKAPG
jgi:hypothetical protein